MYSRDQTDLCERVCVRVCVCVSFIGSKNGHTQTCAWLSFIHIGLALAINGLRTSMCVQCVPAFVSSALSQIFRSKSMHMRSHWASMGHTHVCVRQRGKERERDGELVSNVIETNKINANYLVFQFVTLHYSAQLINADFFPCSCCHALSISLTISLSPSLSLTDPQQC